MLKPTVSRALQLPLANVRSVPKPYPGRFPTRILLQRTGEPDYFGKPFQEAGFLIERCMQRRTGFQIYEFDKAHLIARFNSDVFVAPGGPHSGYQNTLWKNRCFYTYHPCCMNLLPLAGNFIAFWLGRFESFRVKETGFYAPLGILSHDLVFQAYAQQVSDSFAGKKRELVDV